MLTCIKYFTLASFINCHVATQPRSIILHVEVADKPLGHPLRPSDTLSDSCSRDHSRPMAEIFGAVASGAGLLSLSMQLLESVQKLKGFYDSSRDAPDTVASLCFDLETMSMALRQFEQYRQNDVLGSALLSRCILACELSVTKIKTAVERVDRLLSKARFAGRVYMGFKEPEVRKLLEEMEHAKSSMLLAYTSYCQ
jgi:hypothetical protein